MSFKPVLALVAAAIAVPSFAAVVDGGPVAQVRYGDLDLASRDGQKMLRGRVDGAVSRVCGVADFQSLHDVSLCRTQVRSEARAELRRKGVTTI